MRRCFAGFYSILAALKGDYIPAAWAIMIAVVFDGLDGWIARLTNSTTRFGIELDSLSDLVSFWSCSCCNTLQMVSSEVWKDRMGSSIPFCGMRRSEACKI